MNILMLFLLAYNNNTPINTNVLILYFLFSNNNFIPCKSQESINNRCCNFSYGNNSKDLNNSVDNNSKDSNNSKVLNNSIQTNNAKKSYDNKSTDKNYNNINYNENTINTSISENYIDSKSPSKKITYYYYDDLKRLRVYNHEDYKNENSNKTNLPNNSSINLFNSSGYGPRNKLTKPLKNYVRLKRVSTTTNYTKTNNLTNNTNPQILKEDYNKKSLSEHTILLNENPTDDHTSKIESLTTPIKNKDSSETSSIEKEQVITEVIPEIPPYLSELEASAMPLKDLTKDSQSPFQDLSSLKEGITLLKDLNKMDSFNDLSSLKEGFGSLKDFKTD